KRFPSPILLDSGNKPKAVRSFMNGDTHEVRLRSERVTARHDFPESWYPVKPEIPRSLVLQRIEAHRNLRCGWGVVKSVKVIGKCRTYHWVGTKSVRWPSFSIFTRL